MAQQLKVDYPYPVLSSDNQDYNPSCSFDFTISDDSNIYDKEFFSIRAGYNLSCPSLESLISNKEADVIIAAECPATAYRDLVIFPSTQKNITLKIPRNSIINQVKIQCYIVAAKRLARYTSSDFNQDYFSGAYFDIARGSFLAIDDFATIAVDDSELEKALESIFSICALNENESGPFKVEFTSDKIQIYLDRNLRQQYDQMARTYDSIVMCSIIYPPLVKAVSIVLDAHTYGETDYASNRWFKVLDAKIQQRFTSEADLNAIAEDPSSSITLASELLGDVCSRSLGQLKALFDDSDN